MVATPPTPRLGSGVPLHADEVNRATWADGATVAAMTSEGWVDEGERQALLSVVDRLRGRRILDVGIGTGRTTSLLRLLTEDYVGVDYTMEMLEVARRRHPGVDLRWADARDLADFADASFDAAVFSFNGIDALDHAGRRIALAELRRVLAPGGLLLFSTLNKSGPYWNESPWRPVGQPWAAGSLTPPSPRSMVRRMVAGAARMPLHLPVRVRGARNRRRLQAGIVDGGGWGIGPLGGHGFGLLTHFTTLPEAAGELAECGFDLQAAFAADDGRRLDPASDPRDVRWFDLVAAVADGSGDAL